MFDERNICQIKTQVINPEKLLIRQISPKSIGTQSTCTFDHWELVPAEDLRIMNGCIIQSSYEDPGQWNQCDVSGKYTKTCKRGVKERRISSILWIWKMSVFNCFKFFLGFWKLQIPSDNLVHTSNCSAFPFFFILYILLSLYNYTV